MMHRIKCCLYILMAKRYAVFTADEGKNIGKRTYSHIHNSNAPFLSAIVSYVRNLAEDFKKIGELIIEEVEK